MLESSPLETKTIKGAWSAEVKKNYRGVCVALGVLCDRTKYPVKIRRYSGFWELERKPGSIRYQIAIAQSGVIISIRPCSQDFWKNDQSK